MVLLQRKKKTILFQGSRGGLTFSRGWGSNVFQGGGVRMLISIETHITCDFLGGGGVPTPIHPLDPHMNHTLQTNPWQCEDES